MRPSEKEAWLGLIDREDSQYGLYEPIARNKDINLIEAIKKNRLDILKCMKNLGLSFQTCLEKYMMTPIEAAARWGHVNIVEFLLDSGEDIDHKNVLYQTPLFPALQYKNSNVVRFLLKRKANVNVKDAFGQTPVMFFIMRGACRTESDLDILKCLLEAGATVCTADTQTGLMPIHAAICKSGIPDKTVQLLLKYVTDIDAKCKGGWSGLHFSCATSNDVMFIEEIDKTKRCQIVSLLLQNGADPNITDDKYEAPLHVAARNGYAKVSEILIEYGADPTLRDIDGNRPIEYSQPQSGVWYVLRSAMKEKRLSGRSTPGRNSPTMTTSGSRVFFPDKDDVDAPMLSESLEHESIGVMTSAPCNPRDEAWQDVRDKITNLESSIENKDPNVLLHELGLLKQSLSNLKGQEDFIFSQIWPGGYPLSKGNQEADSKDIKSPPRSKPVFKLKVDLVNPVDLTDSEHELSHEELVREERVFFKGCRIAADLLGLDWKMVFRDLEVYDPLKTEIIIKEIEQTNPGQLREQSYQALYDWRQIKGRGATLDLLLKHIRECSLVNVAQTIEDRLS